MPSLEGWLEKKGEKGIKMYKSRWFTVTDKQILYYKHKGDQKSRGHINVDDIKNLKNGSDKGYTFELHTPGRFLSLRSIPRS